MRHCFYCSAELGVYADFDPLDACGESECMKAAREIESERKDGYDKFDRVAIGRK
jgi:hypothetical protein